MKSPDVLTVDEALSRMHEFHDILDARSPGEYSLDRLPRAISAPVLTDAERAEVGTLYRNESGFVAKRVGAALVARNIAQLLETQFAEQPREWRPLIYCWRGGNRSGALATVLSRVGWRVSLLEGGYKAFRHRVIDDLEKLPATLQFRVIAGRTGCGKSLLLDALAARGAQVLDLEAIARHRGSVLGRMPGEPQPGQRYFETLIWERLSTFTPDRPVFVESESRRIGTCHLPESLTLAIRQAPCVVLEAERDHRSQLLISQYRHFIEQPDLLEAQLNRLTEVHGHATIQTWRTLLTAGRFDELVQRLLGEHYDPTYDRSMMRNFTRLHEASVVRLDPTQPAALDELATSLLTGVTAQS
ncbi:MAG: tRNA 2-selenouridine(34) synthase MnmH [Betaproteobacteria bacterium]|nr:tRNA 2-selenouridine(34) synthase MnmH [Betaproteobacteria bacterium]